MNRASFDRESLDRVSCTSTTLVQELKDLEFYFIKRVKIVLIDDN